MTLYPKFVNWVNGQPYTFTQTPLNVVDYGADPTGVKDSTAAIQAAINDLPVTGGVVALPQGTYLTSSAITIGNGTSAIGSSTYGVVLMGMGNPISGVGFANKPGVLIKSTGADYVIRVSGPLQGWGIENIALDGNTTNGGMQLISCQFGFCKNLYFRNCINAIQCSVWNVASGSGFSNAECMHNWFETIYIDLMDAAVSYGIQLLGNISVTANAAYNTFSNVIINYPNTVTANGIIGLYVGGADSNLFSDIHIVNGSASCICVQFDYTQMANTFPQANSFYHIDNSGSLVPPIRFQNVGTPGVTFPNLVFDLIRSNGTSDTNATIPNLSFVSPTSITFPTAGLTLSKPTTVTASSYSQVTSDFSLRFNTSTTATVTLLGASIFPGKILNVLNLAAQPVNSASANVVLLTGGAAVTTIITSTAGKWAELQSDGTSWQVMKAN